MAQEFASPKFNRTIPQDDTMERDVCDRCGFIDYQNPKIVIGSIAHDSAGRILLCKRAIDPRRGFWTLPAGYMELHETVEFAALREAREEAGAALELDRVLAIYSVPRISQVQIIFLATLTNPDSLCAGVESEAVQLFAWEDIPWEELAFPSVAWALRHYHDAIEGAGALPFSNPVDGL